MTKQSIPPQNMTNILVINLAFIGDVILSTPVTRALHEAYPAAQIDMLTVPAAAAIAERNPYIHKVHIYDKKGCHKTWPGAIGLVRQLRQYNYDMVICTNFAVRGAMLARAIGAPCRVGYDAQHGKWFLTHTVSAMRPVIRHEAENYLDVLRPLGITTADTSLSLAIRSEDKDYIRKHISLRQDRPVVLICPAGSYELKSWTTAGYIRLLQELAPEAQLGILGGTAERSYLDKLNQAAGNVAQVYGGTFTLPQLAAFIEMADILISVDTAPLHIAQAVGTPVIALFGPTDPVTWGPRGEKDVVFYRKAQCSPCWGKAAPCDHHCMKDIRPEQVIEKALEMITNRR